jgi:hypothetical protein
MTTRPLWQHRSGSRTRSSPRARPGPGIGTASRLPIPLRTEHGWELFYVGFPWPVLAPPTPGRGTLWLGHATSPDGVRWTRSSAAPVADTGELRFPLIHVVREEGQYLIYHDWRFGRGIGLIRLAGADPSSARVAR